MNEGSLSAISGGVFSAASAFTVAAGANIELNGLDQSIGSLAGAGTVTNSNAAAATLTTGSDNTDTTFSGTITDAFAGPLSLVKVGSGTQVFTGANSYTGGTTISGGALQIGNLVDTGSIDGNVTVDASGKLWVVNGDTSGITSIANSGTTGFYAGTSAGNAVISNLGTLNFVGIATGGNAAITNGAAGIVDFSLAGGSPTAGSIAGGGHFYLGGNEITVGGNGTSTTVSGIISDGNLGGGGGTGGSLIKTGIGALTLNGVNTYTGLTTVNAGKLVVGDDTHATASLIGGVLVNSGGTLGGIGTVGSTTIMAGGIHAPGNSPGTQTIDGDYINHGTLAIDVTPTLSDKVIVNGAVDISGATLSLLLSPTSAADWNINNGPYTIIANDGADAVRGAFVSPATKNLLFLDETLDYAGGDGNDVTLDLTRNNVDFADVGRTRNQKATAGGIDSLGSGNVLWNTIALQSDEDATRAAFDALSGEIYASTKLALIEDSHFMRDAVNDRIRAAFDGVGASSMPVLAYGEAGADNGATAAIGKITAPADTDRLAAWGSVFGSWGSFDGNGNAAELSRSVGGFLAGIDGEIASDIRLGFLTGYSHSTFDVDGRSSSGSSDNYHLGLYAGARWNALRLTGGLAYTWHDIETGRSVAFPGFSDSLTGDYSAGTFQAFGEAGYEIGMGAASFEPFANLAYVNLHTDGFTEKGGVAALHVRGETTETTFTTLGIHLASAFDIGGMKAKARGTLGWRHAFGDITPLSTQAFAGGDAFTVAGVPLAKDAALVEAGLDFAVSDNATFGISYSGQFGSGARDNGAKADLRVRF